MADLTGTQSEFDQKAARVMEATGCFQSVAHFMLGRHDGSVEDAIAELWRIYEDDGK